MNRQKGIQRKRQRKKDRKGINSYYFKGIIGNTVYLQSSHCKWEGDIEVLLTMPEIYRKIPSKQYAVLQYIYGSLSSTGES